jgi:hypothetical protein
METRRILPWHVLLALACLLSILQTARGSAIYLESADTFPRHPELQEVTLFRVVPQSTFALSIIQAFPPRLVKIDLTASNDSSCVSTKSLGLAPFFGAGRRFLFYSRFGALFFPRSLIFHFLPRK